MEVVERPTHTGSHPTHPTELATATTHSHRAAPLGWERVVVVARYRPPSLFLESALKGASSGTSPPNQGGKAPDGA